MNLDWTVVLFYIVIFIGIEYFFLRWAFKKKGILKLWGIFIPLKNKDKLFSFFYSLRKTKEWENDKN